MLFSASRQTLFTVLAKQFIAGELVAKWLTGLASNHRHPPLCEFDSHK